MSFTTNTQSLQMSTGGRTAGGENKQDAQKRHRREVIFCILGVIALIALSIVIRLHPDPYQWELTLTQFVQHLDLWNWVNFLLIFPSKVNDPIPSVSALIIWLLSLCTMAFIRWRQKRSPLLWLQAAAFLIMGVVTSAGVNALVAALVARPRPDPNRFPVVLTGDPVPFASFPSGHVEHDVVYYGFLFYLSMTKPVREWRYHKWLLPLQIYVFYDFLVIGYSRILEGDHWAMDIIGGYIEGFLMLFALIFAYRSVTNWLANRHKKRLVAKQV